MRVESTNAESTSLLADVGRRFDNVAQWRSNCTAVRVRRLSTVETKLQLQLHPFLVQFDSACEIFAGLQKHFGQPKSKDLVDLSERLERSVCGFLRANQSPTFWPISPTFASTIRRSGRPPFLHQIVAETETETAAAGCGAKLAERAQPVPTPASIRFAGTHPGPTPNGCARMLGSSRNHFSAIPPCPALRDSTCLVGHSSNCYVTRVKQISYWRASSCEKWPTRIRISGNETTRVTETSAEGILVHAQLPSALRFICNFLLFL